MTSRDRVLKALGHQESDRVPLDLGTTVTTTIHKVAADRALQAHDETRALAAAGAPYEMADVVQGVIAPDAALAEMLRIDTWGLIPPKYPAEAKASVEAVGTRRFVDEYGCTLVQPPGTHYYSVEKGPLADCSTIAEIRRALRFPDLTDGVWLRALERRLAAAPKDRAIVLDKPCAGFFEMPFRVRGSEAFFVDFVARPDLGDYIMDAFLDFRISYWDTMLGTLGDRVDVVAEANDMGCQMGMLVRPDHYRQRIKTRERRLFEAIRRRAPNAVILYHCCGVVREILPDLVEVGVQAINPVQFTPAGVDLAGLKRDFGDDLVFWGGGIDTQQVLPHGSPEQVREQTRRQIEALAPGGGFVFTTVHNVQADVPPENFWAMWKALQEYGAY